MAQHLQDGSFPIRPQQHDGKFYSAESSPLGARPQPDTDTNMIDIDTFLQQNAHLMSSWSLNRKGSASAASVGPDGILGSEPAAAGGTTLSPNSIALLNHECQIRGLPFEFDIRVEPGTETGTKRFVGSFAIRESVVSLERGQASKKDAKALLADMALPLVRQMQGRGGEKGKGPPPRTSLTTITEDDDNVNWIGKLLGIHLIHPPLNHSSPTLN